MAAEVAIRRDHNGGAWRNLAAPLQACARQTCCMGEATAPRLSAHQFWDGRCCRLRGHRRFYRSAGADGRSRVCWTALRLTQPITQKMNATTITKPQFALSLLLVLTATAAQAVVLQPVEDSQDAMVVVLYSESRSAPGSPQSRWPGRASANPVC